MDTNIFLELLLDQKRASECQNLLQLISKGQTEATVTHFSVHAVDTVVADTRSLATLLADSEHSVGLSIYDTNLSDEMAAALISQKFGLSFDDARQYYVADAVVSFDEHFDNLDIRRIEPRDVLRSSQT